MAEGCGRSGADATLSRAMRISHLVRRMRDVRLETERLVLRRFGPEDVETLVAHELDPRIMRYIRDLQPEDQVRAKVGGMFGPWRGEDGEWLGLAMERRAAAGMIGVLALRITEAGHETVEVGWRLHPDHQRQGLCLEACRCLLDLLFGEAGVRKVVAFCVADNTASLRLMQRLGMRQEGRLREFSRLGEVWHDELVCGLLAREWRGGRQPGPEPPFGRVR